MRKAMGFFVAAALAVGLVTGCGTPSKTNMVSKLQSQAEKLDATNYRSTATMTVQMDNGSQTYYVETNYESPSVYKISLGDSSKNINQVIVRNTNGMFIVSPSLQKVFRFNGNWAQNQGHIYLYDQLLQQIAQAKDVKMASKNGIYTFTMPMTTQNDVISKQEVEINGNTLSPQKVVLYDQTGHAVVTLNFTSFQTGVKFTNTEFDPHAIAGADKGAQTTLAMDQPFGYITPNNTLGDSLAMLQPQSSDNTVMKYIGQYGFTLEEWRPVAGDAGFLDAQLVDLYGVPALYSGGGNSHQLTWLNNDIEFALTSSALSQSQMQEVALSTFAQSGK